MTENVWRPIPPPPSTPDRLGLPPYDEKFYLLAGDSGYITTPLRVHVARWCPKYRPLQPWQTHLDDDYTDDGEPPKYWAPLLKEQKI